MTLRSLPEGLIAFYCGVDFLRERRAEPEVAQRLARDRRISSPPPRAPPPRVEASPAVPPARPFGRRQGSIVEADYGRRLPQEINGL
jgi:hypothetical protein